MRAAGRTQGDLQLLSTARAWHAAQHPRDQTFPIPTPGQNQTPRKPCSGAAGTGSYLEALPRKAPTEEVHKHVS